MHRSRIERDNILFSKLSQEEKATLIKLLDKVNEELIIELKNMGMDI